MRRSVLYPGLLLAVAVAAGGCATTPQGVLVLAGAVYVASGVDLSGVDPGAESPEYAAAVLAGETCARLVAGGDVDNADCSRTGGWDKRTGTYDFAFTYDISDAEARSATFAVMVEPDGEARLDVRFDEDQYITCEDGALKGPSIAVGPRAAARTAVRAEPIVDRWQLSVRLAADPDHGFPVWRVERRLGGEPGVIVSCDVDALTGDVLRQDRRVIMPSQDGVRLLNFAPADGS